MIKRNQSALGLDLSDQTVNFCAMSVEGGVVAEGKIALALGSSWRIHGSCRR